MTTLEMHPGPESRNGANGIRPQPSMPDTTGSLPPNKRTSAPALPLRHLAEGDIANVVYPAQPLNEEDHGLMDRVVDHVAREVGVLEAAQIGLQGRQALTAAKQLEAAEGTVNERRAHRASLLSESAETAGSAATVLVRSHADLEQRLAEDHAAYAEGMAEARLAIDPVRPITTQGIQQAVEERRISAELKSGLLGIVPDLEKRRQGVTDILISLLLNILLPIALGTVTGIAMGLALGILTDNDLRGHDILGKVAPVALIGALVLLALGETVTRLSRLIGMQLEPRRMDVEGKDPVAPLRLRVVTAALLLVLMLVVCSEITVGTVGMQDLNTMNRAKIARLVGKSPGPPRPIFVFVVIATIVSGTSLGMKAAKGFAEVAAAHRRAAVKAQLHADEQKLLDSDAVGKAWRAAARIEVLMPILTWLGERADLRMAQLFALDEPPLTAEEQAVIRMARDIASGQGVHYARELARLQPARQTKAAVIPGIGIAQNALSRFQGWFHGRRNENEPG